MGGSRRNIAMTFGTEKLGKTRMVWLPDSEKNEDMFIRFDRMHEHRQTDGQTDRHHMTA